MARPRKEELRLQMADGIKDAARQEMTERGTAGLSLRGIARRLEITAPAVYNYFPSLDDLITALIVDAYAALADFMEHSGETLHTAACLPRARAAILAYRRWALDHPVEFQLIYGNPIPGYTAPDEVTAPLAGRPFATLFRYLSEALQQGEITLPARYRDLPPSIAAHLASREAASSLAAENRLAAASSPAIPSDLFYFLVAGWARVHGMVMLELFHHTQDVIGDPEAFYTHEVDALLESLFLP